MKFAAVWFFAVVIAAVPADGYYKDQTTLFGERGSELNSVEAFISAPAPSGTVWEYYSYPSSSKPGCRIVGIGATDNIKNGTNGVVKIEGGGVGYKYATVRIESLQPGYGFDYTITFYGKP